MIIELMERRDRLIEQAEGDKSLTEEFPDNKHFVKTYEDTKNELDSLIQAIDILLKQEEKEEEGMNETLSIAVGKIEKHIIKYKEHVDEVEAEMRDSGSSESEITECMTRLSDRYQTECMLTITGLLSYIAAKL